VTDRLRKSYRFSTVPEHLIRDKSLTDRAFRLWCILDRYAGANGEAFPSRRSLGLDLDCSMKSIDRALAELVERGWLAKERREAGASNDYTLLIAAVPTEGRDTGDPRGVGTPLSPPRDTSDHTQGHHSPEGRDTGDAHKEESSKEESPKETPRSARSGAKGARLPDDWWPNEKLQDWYRQQPYAGRMNPVEITEEFRRFWWAKTGQHATKLDWGMTWQNWISREGRKVMGTGRAAPTNVHRDTSDPARAERLADWSTDTGAPRD